LRGTISIRVKRDSNILFYPRLGRRIKRLTHQTWLAVLIVISAFVQFCESFISFTHYYTALKYWWLVCGTGVTIGISIIRFWAEAQKFQSIVIVWLVLSALTDIAIAISMVWYLVRRRDLRALHRPDTNCVGCSDATVRASQ
jgi:hypothetical protein